MTKRLFIAAMTVGLSGCALFHPGPPIPAAERHDPWRVKCEDESNQLMCTARRPAYGPPEGHWWESRGLVGIAIKLDQSGRWVGPFAYTDTDFLSDDDELLKGGRMKEFAVLRIDNGPGTVMNGVEAGSKVLPALLAGRIARADPVRADPDPADACIANLEGIQEAYLKLLQLAETHGFNGAAYRQGE